MADDNKLLGQFDLVGIPPAPRGTPQIEVTFDIDANGIVKVSATDKATAKEQQITIQSSGGLSDAEVDKMVKDAQAHSESDKKRKKFIEAKNSADTLIYQTEKSLSEHRDKVPQDDVAAIEGEIKKLRDALETEKDGDKINDLISSLQKVSTKIGEAVYKKGSSSSNSSSGGAEGTGSSGSSGAGEKTENSETVDADFEEQNKKKQ